MRNSYWIPVSYFSSYLFVQGALNCIRNVSRSEVIAFRNNWQLIDAHHTGRSKENLNICALSLSILQKLINGFYVRYYSHQAAASPDLINVILIPTSTFPWLHSYLLGVLMLLFQNQFAYQYDNLHMFFFGRENIVTV